MKKNTIVFVVVIISVVILGGLITQNILKEKLEKQIDDLSKEVGGNVEPTLSIVTTPNTSSSTEKYDCFSKIDSLGKTIFTETVSIGSSVNITKSIVAGCTGQRSFRNPGCKDNRLILNEGSCPRLNEKCVEKGSGIPFCEVVLDTSTINITLKCKDDELSGTEIEVNSWISRNLCSDKRIGEYPDENGKFVNGFCCKIANSSNNL